jgi:hypothetical protein
VSTKVSACVDCATSIIGDQLRCSACHDQHSRRESLGHVAISWMVFLEIIVVLVLGGVLATRGCL